MYRNGGVTLWLTAALLFFGGFAPSIRHALAMENAALDFFAGLGPGWNLGNALDAYNKSDPYPPHDAELRWGNPKVDKELFAALHEAGFRTVRIPVTWDAHMDKDGKVGEEWMERVVRVVTDALDAGLYVVINSHHDHWYSPFEEKADEAEKKLVALWRQIAERFAAFDERLIFESMNEPRLVGTDREWTPGTPAAHAVVNRLNQAFVDTVRAVPGENRLRYLLVPPYLAMAHPVSIAGFVVPADERLGVSLHIYWPMEFTSPKVDVKRWDANDPEDSAILAAIFAGINRRFVMRGIPVAITEFGAVDKDNEAERAHWARFIRQLATVAAIPLIWWDNGMKKESDGRLTYALIDRHTLTWRSPELVKALTEDRDPPAEAEE